jgi:hypothetical protein
MLMARSRSNRPSAALARISAVVTLLIAAGGMPVRALADHKQTLFFEAPA